MANVAVRNRPIHSVRASLSLQKLAEKDPGFASLSMWLYHVDVETDFAPAFTDGKSVYYAPAFAAWNLAEQVGVSAHEIMHVAFRHSSRGRKLRERFGGDYQHDVFNIATDAIINQTLLLAKYTLPRPCIVLVELLKEALGIDVDPETAVGEWDAEKLYIRLLQAQKDNAGKSGKGRESADGSEGGKGKGQPSIQDIMEAVRKYAASKGFVPDLEENEAGDEVDENGVSRSEASIDAEWAQRVAMARAGCGHGILSHRLADLPTVKTPWEQILRTLVNRAVTRTPKFSMGRPSRRWLGMESDALAHARPTPGFEPGIQRQNDRPRIVIGVDVSGSIGDPLLKRFAAEIASVGKKTGAEVHVIVFDDGILSETQMKGMNWEKEIMDVTFARGGGTSFIEVVNRCAELKASIGIILTDLMGPFGDAPKGIPVIWAIPDEEAPANYVPPFGTVLSLAR